MNSFLSKEKCNFSKLKTFLNKKISFTSYNSYLFLFIFNNICKHE